MRRGTNDIVDQHHRLHARDGDEQLRHDDDDDGSTADNNQDVGDWDVYKDVGGQFSLGKAQHGSGYCVGVVVEKPNAGFGGVEGGVHLSDRHGRGEVRGGSGGGSGVGENGLEDSWILGEAFLKGVNALFDVGVQIFLHGSCYFMSITLIRRGCQQAQGQRVAFRPY